MAKKKRDPKEIIEINGLNFELTKENRCRTFKGKYLGYTIKIICLSKKVVIITKGNEHCNDYVTREHLETIVDELIEDIDVIVETGGKICS